MTLYKGIQDDIKALGSEGCAFLCACYVLGLDIEELPKKIAMCQNDLSLASDFEIKSWERVFNNLGAHGEKKYSVLKTDVWTTDFKYCIGMFYNPTTKLTHFVVLNKNKEIDFDPVRNSITVRDGYLKDFRFVKEI